MLQSVTEAAMRGEKSPPPPSLSQSKEGSFPDGKICDQVFARAREIHKGPYIKDVRKIFGILDPLPPLSAFWLDL